MKKNVILFCFGLFLVLASCNEQLMEKPLGLALDFTFKVEVGNASNSGPDTRSSYAANLQNKITDHSIFVFDAKGSFVSQNYYGGSDNMKGRDLFINDDLGTSFDNNFEVYIIANLGDLRNKAELCSNGKPDMNKIKNYKYSFSDNFSEFNQKGFPMAGYYDSYCPSTDSRTLYANKLVTQYNIRFTKSSSNPNTYTIKSGQLKNVPNKCTPFKTFKAIDGETSLNGDYFISSDISALNNGNYMSLFVLENEQGNVFSASSEKERTYDNLNDANKRKCTYAEFDVTVQTPTAKYENVKYRYYFGDNLKDCSIHRNMIYDLTLNFENVIVEDEGWRIEPGKPVVDNDAIVLNREKLSIIKGMSNSFTVTRKPGVNYNISYSTSDAATYGLNISKTTGTNQDTYTISTNWSGYTKDGTISRVNYKDIPITFTTTDGIVSKKFIVRIQLNPIIIEFDYQGGIPSAIVSNTVDWPEGTQFFFKNSGIIYGENVYCNNRTFNKYTCHVWEKDFSRFNTYKSLLSGDASELTFQTITSESKIIKNLMDEINSNETSHAYAVGKDTKHYTAIGHALLDITFMFANVKSNIIKTIYDIPVTYIAQNHRRDGSSITVSSTKPSVTLSYKPLKVPAWVYTNGNFMDNSFVDDTPEYLLGYTSTSTYYTVSFNDVFKAQTNSLYSHSTFTYEADGFYQFDYNTITLTKKGTATEDVGAYVTYQISGITDIPISNW